LVKNTPSSGGELRSCDLRVQNRFNTGLRTFLRDQQARLNNLNKIIGTANERIAALRKAAAPRKRRSVRSTLIAPATIRSSGAHPARHSATARRGDPADGTGPRFQALKYARVENHRLGGSR
jgi:hypothetical protein